MPLYESKKNSENSITIEPEWRDAIVMGSDAVVKNIVQLLAANRGQKRALLVAFDGWYGIDWVSLIVALKSQLATAGLEVSFRPILEAFKSRKEIATYKRAFAETDDPGFGVVNNDGRIIDLLSAEKLAAVRAALVAPGGTDAVVLFGPGAAIPELNDHYDLRFYFDKTRQPILWDLWGGKLIPFGWSEPDPRYGWKDYYYCDYHLLDRQKEFLLPRMDYWVEGIAIDSLKLVPRAAYDGILRTLVQYPIKEVPIFQPGPWGAYRYRDLFDVPGLECNAWNQIVGPELSMLVDVGREAMLNMPTMNLMQYSEQFVGKYLTETYPRLFPIDAWLDDGYFPKPEPAERISMPIHIHPNTEYVQRHFKEPLGRYETYYIAEAYEGAGTWLGFKDAADIEEWERLCRASNNLKEIPNWKDFIKRWDNNVGDLYLIPGGTIHGHGGNQMVLEMDTCPSIAGTEYSFFLYDFARPSWDDESKTMTGKPLKMHMDHGSDANKWVRESWAGDHLRAKPRVIKWTKEYVFERYSSDPRMPFEIERLHFTQRAENDTEGKFLHVVTLTVGDKVVIRSKTNPAYSNAIRKFQSALVPACFGEYEFVNEVGGACTVVQMRWKRG
jgi:hypothetical protein